MYRRTQRLIPVPFILLLIILAACIPTQPTAVSDQQSGPQAQVQPTATRRPTITPRPATPTAQVPIRFPTRTPTNPVTETALALTAQTPTLTFEPVSADAACDQAAFIEDVNYPDQTFIEPDTEFTKTWRLKNIGSCTWTTSYALVLDSGAQFEGPTVQYLPAEVAPGQMIDLSIKLKTPRQSGVYKSYWKIRNSAGQVFGTGKLSIPFSMFLIVSNPTDLRYDFTGFNCNAVWTGNGQPVPCHTNQDPRTGYTRIISIPRLEDGSEDDEYGLMSVPPREPGGAIHGVFSEFTIRKGDHFMTVIGCLHEYTKCDITFRLDYQYGDGPIQNYASWNQVYDKKMFSVDIELSELYGETVHMILTVINNNGAEDSRGFWLKPRIKTGPISADQTPTAGPSPTPGPTQTSTVTPTETLVSYP